MTLSGLGRSWRSDLPASIVVALVALPLCLGVALASGAPLFAGLISGIVGGLVLLLLLAGAAFWWRRHRAARARRRTGPASDEPVLAAGEPVPAADPSMTASDDRG